MRRAFLTAIALALSAGMLQGCSVVYCRTVHKPDPDRRVTEFGLLGVPDGAVDDDVPASGFLPLWRSSKPVHMPRGEGE